MLQISVNSDLSENVRYNNKEFPAYMKKARLSFYPDFRAMCHWHTDFEFIYVYDGQMEYYVNDEVVSIFKGQGIFVNSRCLHYGFSSSKSECSFLCILLHPSLLSSNQFFQRTVLSPIVENQNLPFIKLQKSVEWQNRIILELLKIENTVGKENEEIKTVCSFSNIISLIAENSKENAELKITKKDEDLNLLSLMIGFVQQNYKEKISVAQLASAGKCCKTKCTDLFRKYLNTTPLGYLTSYRLEKSASLLVNTTSSITEIAYDSGFAGSSYFSESFLKHYGITPKQYRIKRPNESVKENP